MTVVADLDLPVLDHTDEELRGDRFHEVLDGLAAQGWLARSPLGHVVLEREAGMEFLRDRRLAFPAVELLELQGITEGPVHDRTKNGLMARTGADHSRLRRLVTPAFTPRATERLRSRRAELLESLWAPMARRRSCDFVPDFAARLPSMVIAELLGLPGEDERLAQWSTDLQAVFDMEGDDERRLLERAYLEVYEWVHDLVLRRRASPGDDLVSVLATVEEDGDRLDDQECTTLVCSVIAGGTDTTQAQLAQGMRLFVEHPDQWEALAAAPELAVRAGNEVLRYEPITPFTARLVHDEMDYRGVTFPPGSVVFVCAATANRDPSAFQAPDRFDVTLDRGTTQILTFGFGAHFCLGVNLARAEVAEAFGFLAPRMANPVLDGEVVFTSPTGIYGLEALPLRFDVR